MIGGWHRCAPTGAERDGRTEPRPVFPQGHLPRQPYPDVAEAMERAEQLGFYHAAGAAPRRGHNTAEGWHGHARRPAAVDHVVWRLWLGGLVPQRHRAADLRRTHGQSGGDRSAITDAAKSWAGLATPRLRESSRRRSAMRTPVCSPTSRRFATTAIRSRFSFVSHEERRAGRSSEAKDTRYPTWEGPSHDPDCRSDNHGRDGKHGRGGIRSWAGSAQQREPGSFCQSRGFCALR